MGLLDTCASESCMLREEAQSPDGLIPDGPFLYTKLRLDEFAYLVHLRDGSTYYCRGGERYEHPFCDWMHLNGVRPVLHPNMEYERGMDVRISAIVAVIDAPEGS